MNHICITVRLFARAKDLAGSETVDVTVAEGGTLADLRSALSAAHPQLLPIVGHLHFARGTEYLNPQTHLTISEELVAFPPVSGG